MLTIWFLCIYFTKLLAEEAGYCVENNYKYFGHYVNELDLSRKPTGKRLLEVIETGTSVLCSGGAANLNLVLEKAHNVFGICGNSYRNRNRNRNIYSCAGILAIENIKKAEILPSRINLDWKDLRKIILRNLNISTTVPGWFSQFQDLEDIDLSNNSISVITEGMLSGPKYLQRLDLSENLIENIQDHAFNGLNDLYLVKLNKNKILVWRPNLFINNIYLEVLFMHDNRLTFIEDNFNFKVNIVDLSLNGIKSINFSKFNSSIIELNISNNLIDIITDSEFFNGTYLDISSNRLKNIVKFPSVKYLNVNQNLISIITNLSTSLLEFDISFNRLTYLDADVFKNATNITTLNLHRNSIKSVLINVFSNLKNLQNLDLSENKIYEIIFNFNGINQNYIKLNISGNLLNNLDVYSLMITYPRMRIDLNDNLWECQKLAKYVQLFEISKIGLHFKNGSYGSNFNESVKNITCFTKNPLLNKNIVINSGNVSEILSNSFYKYLNIDFKSSNFYKYLENLNSSEINQESIKKFLKEGLSQISEDLKKNSHPRDTVLDIFVGIIICILLVVCFTHLKKRQAHLQDELPMVSHSSA